MYFTVDDPDFKAGIASLSMILQVPPYNDHLEQLKVCTIYLISITMYTSWPTKSLTSSYVTFATLLSCLIYLDM